MSSHALVVGDAFCLRRTALLAGQRQHDHGGDERHHVVDLLRPVQVLQQREAVGDVCHGAEQGEDQPPEACKPPYLCLVIIHPYLLTPDERIS